MAVAHESTTRSKLSPGVADARPRRRLPGNALALMVLAFVVLAVAAYSVLADREVSYLAAVTAQDLRAGTIVDADALEWTEVRLAEDVAATLLLRADADDVDGWVAANNVPAGQLVSRGDLRAPATDSAMRAVSIPLPPERAVAGDIAAGDRVDVIAVRDSRAEYVAVDLQVLGVSGQSDGPLRSTGGGGWSVTVAVDADTALALARALDTSTVSVARSTGATPAQPTPTDSATSDEPAS